MPPKAHRCFFGTNPTFTPLHATPSPYRPAAVRRIPGRLRRHGGAKARRRPARPPRRHAHAGASRACKACLLHFLPPSTRCRKTTRRWLKSAWWNNGSGAWGAKPSIHFSATAALPPGNNSGGISVFFATCSPRNCASTNSAAMRPSLVMGAPMVVNCGLNKLLISGN